MSGESLSASAVRGLALVGITVDGHQYALRVVKGPNPTAAAAGDSSTAGDSSAAPGAGLAEAHRRVTDTSLGWQHGSVEADARLRRYRSRLSSSSFFVFINLITSVYDFF